MRGQLSWLVDGKFRVIYSAAIAVGVWLCNSSNADPVKTTVQVNDIADRPDAAEPLPSNYPVDVTEFLDLKVSSLRAEGVGRYSATVSLRNITDESIPGPLLFVVEGTGVDGLSAVEGDGLVRSHPQTDDAEEQQPRQKANTRKTVPYFELLRFGILKKSKATKSRRVHFESARKLTPDDRKSFQLDWRVTRAFPARVGNGKHKEAVAKGFR